MAWIATILFLIAEAATADEGAGVGAPQWPSLTEAVALLERVPSVAADLQRVSGPEQLVGEHLQASLAEEFETLRTYDLQWALGAGYGHSATGTLLQVHLLSFGCELDAFAAFSWWRDPSQPGELVPLPGQASVVSAYWSGNLLRVWRGPLYLRVSPGSGAADARPVILALAQAVLEGLPEMVADPPLFQIPPTRNLIVESVRFVREGVFDQKKLGGALLATYGRRTVRGGLEVAAELALFAGENRSGADSLYSALREYLTAEIPARPVLALGEDAFTLRHKRHGLTLVMRQGAYVAMVYQVRDTLAAEAMLREIAKRIRAQEPLAPVKSDSEDVGDR